MISARAKLRADRENEARSLLGRTSRPSPELPVWAVNLLLGSPDREVRAAATRYLFLDQSAYLTCKDPHFAHSWRSEPRNYTGRGFVYLFHTEAEARAWTKRKNSEKRGKAK